MAIICIALAAFSRYLIVICVSDQQQTTLVYSLETFIEFTTAEQFAEWTTAVRRMKKGLLIEIIFNSDMIFVRLVFAVRWTYSGSTMGTKWQRSNTLTVTFERRNCASNRAFSGGRIFKTTTKVFITTHIYYTQHMQHIHTHTHR